MSSTQIFQKSRWIWADCEYCEDQYTEYLDSFFGRSNDTTVNISCDSDYVLYVNGSYVASNQYGDFEHYKIYDTLDISSYLCDGENIINITVYHCGVNTQRYRRAEAGLIYEIIKDGETVAFSSRDTLSRPSPTYASGKKLAVSSQLGFTFSYDATANTDGGYSPSVCVEKNTVFYPRPIKKQKVLPRKEMKSVRKTDFGYLIDLGEETVGYATLDIVSKGEQTLTFAYGESLDGGRVRAKIHNRNFFFTYKARDGENLFTDYMLRLGCRYIELICDRDTKINYVGILPQIYEVKSLPRTLSDKLDSDIYGICLNTLKLCMMEHYVDTPWREQCLYAFDARNQMLCGYYAFENQNKDYARANLALMSEDRRDDGLLSICYPCGTKLAIPSFSLYYVIAVKEYLFYTDDTSLPKKYLSKIESVLDEFLSNTENGLINRFSGDEMWNFYDWSPYLSGSGQKGEQACPDLIINCLFILALDSFEKICARLGVPFKYCGAAEKLRSLVSSEFTGDNGLLSVRKGKDEYTALGNSLAILSGAVTGARATEICDRIIAGETVESSLSMNVWKYDALMLTDTERYKDYILGQIRHNYKKMLDAGSTTVWETALGSSDFGNAGSLCHGWSAVPIYIYHRLGMAKNVDIRKTVTSGESYEKEDIRYN